MITCGPESFRAEMRGLLEEVGYTPDMRMEMDEDLKMHFGRDLPAVPRQAEADSSIGTENGNDTGGREDTTANEEPPHRQHRECNGDSVNSADGPDCDMTNVDGNTNIEDSMCNGHVPDGLIEE